MRAQSLLMATAIAISVAFANPSEGGQRQRRPGGAQGGQGQSQGGQSQQGERRAEPRSGGARRESPERPAPAPQARQSSPERQQPQLRQQPQARQQPEARTVPEERQQPAPRSARVPGIRERGDLTQNQRRGGDSGTWAGDGRHSNGYVGPRVAVPRQGPPPRHRDDHNGYRDGHWNGYRGYAPYGGIYYNSYPRSYYYPYAYGYGPGGRGHFYFDLYYDSYVWHPQTIVRYSNYDTAVNYGYPTGELRLQVQPRDAQVFVDGYYAGTVDDFDGTFQSLRLEEGPYRIEIVLPGYEPLDFDVRIIPGEKVTYRGVLLPERP